jgi:hypothetical protein
VTPFTVFTKGSVRFGALTVTVRVSLSRQPKV